MNEALNDSREFIRNELKGQLEVPVLENYDGMMDVYKISIRSAFENEGVGHLDDDINNEITYKALNLNQYFSGKDKSRHYLIALVDQKIVGTISFGPIGKETQENIEDDFPSQGELGGLYILPDFQGQGIGSQLIGLMIEKMKDLGIEKFSLDSGYELAQKRWCHKFGQPYKVIKDYWGEDTDHMIWLCNVNDF